MKTKPSLRSGFSLLEVLLAVLILGIALSVFFAAANQGVAVAIQAREYQISSDMLEELALREPIDVEAIEEGELSGHFSHPEHGSIEWTRTFEVVGREEDRFYKLTTQVARGNGLGGKSESFETFIHQPTALASDWVQEPFDEL
ncbi:prepilin-type N-terminal cleavage/methylation domain-containing protein [Kiritimatiellota bacterium B12222]|nr:prepilin-type N-terminal cleavage/methylation domain-containing protein [Kiritimatiellota bacterium B12222]